MTSQAAPQKIAVVGGGISGLATAHRMIELRESPDLTLFEAAGRLGGVLETTRTQGYLLERSADNFITNLPWAVGLCRRIGFEDQLLRTNDAHRQAFVVRKGRLCKIPEGFLIMAPSRIWPMVTTPILSPWGKLRMAWEYFVSRKDSDDDESLAAFATRRLGREAYERLVQPLVGGIYSADPEQLSVGATMPRFIEMERQHGGLIRGVLKQSAARKQQGDQKSSGARYSLFVTPRDGMSSLVDEIAGRLPEGTVRLNSPVQEIRVTDAGQWELTVGGEQPGRQTFDAVVVALPAHRAAELLKNADAELAEDLTKIPYAGCSVVSVAYRREQIGHPMDGFGFVVPLVEKLRLLSGSFSSVKYPGRAPENHVLLRAFIGGACQPELVDLPDDELVAVAAEEFGGLLQIKGEPIFSQISRWHGTMAQYHLGHCELVERIESRTATHNGLALAGNAYHGVGVPQCIHSGETAAERILAVT